MRTLLLVLLAQLTCACTPHEIRCDGHLERINADATMPDAAAGVP
ncbi:MAG TPA: hypothetical protein VMT09_13155 [Steroidobacteraceae bacterium]|nr:hypothetical protein [Steroidobacteraceae bacterium]